MGKMIQNHSKDFNMKREANFQRRFNHWVKEVFKQTAAFELKQTKTDSLPFAAVVPHQRGALRNAKGGTFVFKIPDAGYQNPFDSFCLHEVPAYVVIKYPDFFCLVGIQDFLEEEIISDRRSLTADRARKIAHIIVDD